MDIVISKYAKKTLKLLVNKNQDIFNVTSKDCKLENLIELADAKLIKLMVINQHLENWAYQVVVNKETKKYLLKEAKHTEEKIWEYIRYGITTLISITALLLSIFL